MFFFVLIWTIFGLGYLYSLLYPAKSILRTLLSENTTKHLLFALCNYLPFLLSYLYLYSQTSQVNLGIWIMPFYFLIYFYWILAVTVFQNKFFIAVLFSTTNGVLLMSLQISRSVGLLGWEFLIGIPVLLIFLANHFVSLGYVLHQIKKKKK